MGSVTIKHITSKTLENSIQNMKIQYVKIGWFPSSRYDDEKRTPVAYIAAQNEYGNPNKNIPARPFIRPTIAQNNKKWQNIGKRGIKAVINRTSTVSNVLDSIGISIRDDIQRAITRVYSPPLKKSTIEARLARRTHSGRLNKTQAQSITKPLVDTGYMLATVSYELSSSP